MKFWRRCRDFGNFVNRARRSFGENTGSEGFWDFCSEQEERNFWRRRVEGDFGNFGNYA